jgi:hypothetical protein
MFTRIAIVLVLAASAFAQIHTDCTISGNTASCTSTDTGAAIAERNREYAQAGNQMGQAFAVGVGRIIQNSRARHAAKREAKRSQYATKEDRAFCISRIGTPAGVPAWCGQ